MLQHQALELAKRVLHCFYSIHSKFVGKAHDGEGRRRLLLGESPLFAKHEDPEVEIHEDSALGVSFVVGQPKLSGDECKRGVGLMTMMTAIACSKI